MNRTGIPDTAFAGRHAVERDRTIAYLQVAPMATREVQSCIDACNACMSAANACLAWHAGEQDMKQCLVLCLDCVDLCSACVHMLARSSANGPKVCEVCAEACDRCAGECAKFDSPECKACAEACRKCAERCTEMSAQRLAA